MAPCRLIVNSINDTAQHVALETACQHTVHMWRIQEHSVLVVAVDNKVKQEDYLPHIDEALELIEQGEEWWRKAHAAQRRKQTH